MSTEPIPAVLPPTESKASSTTVSAEPPAHVHGPNCSHDHHHSPQVPFVRSNKKIGRNDDCHCGSGKKYKKCHLDNDVSLGRF